MRKYSRGCVRCVRVLMTGWLAASVLVQAQTGRPAEAMDVVDAYEEAQRLEADIVEMFREIRAAELSRVQRQTLERSLGATLMPLSDRAEVDEELLRRKAADAEGIRQYQEELAVVMQETEAMVANAQTLLDLFREELAAAESSASERVESVLKDFREERAVSEQQVEAAEAQVERVREALAKVMHADRQASEAGEQTEAEGNTQEAVRQMEAANEAAARAADAVAALAAMGESGGSGDSEASGVDAVARLQALGRLARAGSGRWLDVTEQMRGRNLGGRPRETPPEGRPALWQSLEELEASPSIRIVRAGSAGRREWYFIGDWYVLSRYANEGRENLQKVYPPESIQDLDAVYLSEDGKRMEWEYESYLPPVVIPYGWESWKIYYFYTELYFEEETEAWLAIGSDDRSDLWINDLPVWHSRNQHKGWSPDEGFRRVVFRQGRNPVLLRLENGHQGLGFSLFLNFDGF